MDRQKQGGAGDQFLIVEIPGVRARRPARKTPDKRGRRNPDGSPKRSQLQRNARAEFRGSRPGINRDPFESGVGEVIRERAAARTESSHAIRM